MINPKSLVSALHSHWEVMIALTTLSREYPAFSSDMVLEEIAKAHTAKNQEEHEALLRQLIGTELLSLHSRSNTLEIHPLVQEFVRGLMREHELGLSEVLRVRVSAIKDTTNSLVDGLQSMKMEQIVSACRKLNELFRQIAQQLDQDRHATHEIAERAKTAGGGIPVSRRYREVIEAYDQYILPMTEMMNSGPTGTFSAHMDKAIRTLEGDREKLLIQGALYRHQEQLNLVNGQAKELQRQGRLILKECSDTSIKAEHQPIQIRQVPTSPTARHSASPSPPTGRARICPTRSSTRSAPRTIGGSACCSAKATKTGRSWQACWGSNIWSAIRVSRARGLGVKMRRRSSRCWTKHSRNSRWKKRRRHWIPWKPYGRRC